MSIKGGGKAGVKELARKICIGLFIREVVDEAVSIDRDINTVDTSRRTWKITQLSGCEGHRGKGFLFSEGSFWFHRGDRSDRGFNDGKSFGDG